VGGCTLGIDSEVDRLSEAAELRRQAEQRLPAKRSDGHGPLTNEEPHKLVHELEVHQVELEMQNAELRQAREAAEKVLERYTDLYDFAPVGYLTLDRGGVVLAANLAAADLLGVKRPGLIARGFDQYLAGQSRPPFFEFLGKVFAGQGKQSCELVCIPGEDQALFVQVEAVADRSGRECRMALVDVSRRKKTERLLAEAQRLARLGSWEWDILADSITGSEEFYRIYGGAFCSFAGFMQQVHRDDRDRVGAAVRGSLDGRSPYDVRYRIVRLDGAIRIIHALGEAVTNGSGVSIKMIGTSQDITEQSVTEEELANKRRELESLNESLEERIGQAVNELREKDQELLRKSRQAVMGEMINNIAHQWRLPLNALGLLVQEAELRYEAGQCSNEFFRGYVSRTMELIKHMSRTIDDFRDFFKVDKKSVLFDVNKVIARTLSLVEQSFNELSIAISLHSEGNPVIEGYPSEYSQVLLNILINARDALVANDVSGSPISIRAFSEAGKSVVTISDEGGGIAEEIIDKLFDPYFTTKGPEQGAGIGLFMAKSIIEKSMGGRLMARNTGGGAEFRIEI